MTKLVLSLDGGGVRGAATAHFLKMVEADIKKPIYDCFDMFAGTSTGAIIATCIGVNRMSANEVDGLYSYENTNKIMPSSFWDKRFGLAQDRPKFDGKGKTEVIKKYLGEVAFESDFKPVVVPSYDIRKRKIKVFKTWRNKKESGYLNLPAWQIVDASSAAPCYFPPVYVKENGWFIDGGVVANNPAMCAYAQAIKIWPNEEIKMLSVGTGKVTRPINGIEAVGYGSVEWMMHDLLGIVMDESPVDYQMKQILGKNYIRVNSDLLDVNDEMDDCSRRNLYGLKTLSEKWFKDHAEEVFKLLS